MVAVVIRVDSDVPASGRLAGTSKPALVSSGAGVV